VGLFFTVTGWWFGDISLPVLIGASALALLRACFPSRTKLAGADLRGANLAGANLYRADLSDADLTDANLSGAKLGRVKRSGAVMPVAG
jgi:uncharacterized protein YjbI with pentapeptide repeats